MTTRYGWRWTDTAFSGDHQVFEEKSKGEFVHYLDYAAVVNAVRDLILDLDYLGRSTTAKKQAEKLLTRLGEEI